MSKMVSLGTLVICLGLALPLAASQSRANVSPDSGHPLFGLGANLPDTDATPGTAAILARHLSGQANDGTMDKRGIKQTYGDISTQSNLNEKDIYLYSGKDLGSISSLKEGKSLLDSQPPPNYSSLKHIQATQGVASQARLIALVDSAAADRLSLTTLRMSGHGGGAPTAMIEPAIPGPVSFAGLSESYLGGRTLDPVIEFATFGELILLPLQSANPVAEILEPVIELAINDRLSSATLRESYLDGGPILGTPFGKRSTSKFKLKNKRHIVVFKAVISIGSTGYDYWHGNISNLRAGFQVAESVVTILAAIIPLTRPAVTYIPSIFSLIDSTIITPYEMARWEIIQRGFNALDIAKSLSLREKELTRLETESKNLLNEAWTSLANSKLRF